ncbi:MAG: PilZ domain-containing protein [Gallionellaceae bacterium]|nr:PilZ domain-containing protein [Gallionellaceae bacterium]
MDQQTSQERRISKRISTNLDMRLYAYGNLVASGMTVDISEHGLRLCIQQDYSADELAPGKHLDVVLHDLGRIPAEQWLPIMVVRNWEEGIAASFIGVEARAA